MVTKSSLTPKQSLFIVEYLLSKNASRAAKNAGYSAKTARSAGSRLLTNVDISNAIEKGLRDQLERADISSDHILDAIKRVAFSKYDIGGKMRALELLGKSLGIFHDKSEPQTPAMSAFDLLTPVRKF